MSNNIFVNGSLVYFYGELNSSKITAKALFIVLLFSVYENSSD